MKLQVAQVPTGRGIQLLGWFEMAHRWGDGRWRRLGRKVMWTEEQSVQVAGGGQRRARSGVQGKEE